MYIYMYIYIYIYTRKRFIHYSVSLLLNKVLPFVDLWLYFLSFYFGHIEKRLDLKHKFDFKIYDATT